MKALDDIAESQLSVGALLGRGGTSAVYELLGDGGELLYKKYIKPRGGDASPDLLSLTADRGVREFLEGHISWPVRRVLDDAGRLAGILVRKAPPQFSVELTVGRTRLRDLHFLLFEQRSERVGIPRVSTKDKLLLVRALVYVLRTLQGLGLVYEDLAAQNVLWNLEPAPDVFLLDSDSIRRVDRPPATPAAMTLDWADPRVRRGDVARPDLDSLSYGIGLLLARIFLEPMWSPPDSGQIEEQALQPAPAALRSVLAGSLRFHGARPTLDRWLEALDHALAALPDTASQPPPAPARRATLLDRARFGGWHYQTKVRAASLAGLICGVVLALVALRMWR